MTTTFVPQRNSIGDGFSMLCRSLAPCHFSKLRQVGRLLAFMCQRQVLAMFRAKDDALSSLRDALTGFLRQVGCTASAIARIGQSAPNESHVLNPERLGVRPRAIGYFFKHQDAWFHSSYLQLTKPMQLMRTVVRGLAQVSTQTLRQAFGLADVTKFTCTWVEQTINRTHLGAAI